MNYWWVNQNKTSRQEVEGGYIWSPKLQRDGKRNHFYETMREVAPGDVIFSFVNQHISNVGVAQSDCFEAPQPSEFGSVGDVWEKDGWRVDVSFERATKAVKPSANMEVLAPLLPSKYSPLREDGTGNQVYLAKISPEMGLAILTLAEHVDAMWITQARIPAATQVGAALREHKERTIEEQLTNDFNLTTTVRQSLVDSRVGQGIFRKRVEQIEKKCRVTGVSNPVHLIASHIKPWRDCSNSERLDGENGLLLAPHIDHLFDKGYISFDPQGLLLISPAADPEAMEQLGVQGLSLSVGKFSDGQLRYLDFHRKEIYRKIAK
jgi:putative restriction endonuclease